MPLSSWHIPVENGQLGGIRNQASGPDVLFVPSHGFSAMIWAPVIERLDESVRVTAMDLRGHAESENAPLVDGNDAWRDVITVIESLGLHKPILMGHDTGGFMALAAAAERPDLVSAAITLDSDFRDDPREVLLDELQLAQEPELRESLKERFLMGAVAKTPEEADAIVAQMVEVATSDWVLTNVGPEIAEEARYLLRKQPDGTWVHTPSVEATTIGYVLDPDTKYFPNWEIYEKVSVPVHLARCTQGLNVLSDADAMRLSKQFRHVTVHTFDAGHVAQYSHRAELANLIGRVAQDIAEP